MTIFMSCIKMRGHSTPAHRMQLCNINIKKNRKAVYSVRWPGMPRTYVCDGSPLISGSA